jgi:pyruvate-ferredoxin/flavodoxin oxidoreductase
MGKTQEETSLAVKSGYWPLYRYNPALAADGKNPFILDSKEPDGSLQTFLAGEVRYAALQKLFPEEAKRLHTRLEAEFADRYTALKRKAEAEYAPAQPSGKVAGQTEGDSDACVLSGTAEHAGRAGADDACDDGRGAK